MDADLTKVSKMTDICGWELDTSGHLPHRTTFQQHPPSSSLLSFLCVKCFLKFGEQETELRLGRRGWIQ